MKIYLSAMCLLFFSTLSALTYEEWEGSGSVDFTGTNESVIVLDNPVLGVNVPNPCSFNTVISYYVPADKKYARIILSDLSGQVIFIKELDIEQTSVELEMYAYDEGLYLYSLELDGMIVMTKRLKIVR